MDYQGYRCCLTGIALLGSLVGIYSKDKLKPFPCSATDVCNRDDKPQFCAADKRCLNCEDYSFRCGKWQMSSNCSAFCCEFKTNATLVRTCAPPWNIFNGHVKVSPESYGRHVSGANLTFLCDEGFEIRGNNTFTCNYNGQWSPKAKSPYCIPVSIPAKWANYFVLVVCISVPSFAFIVSCVVNIYFCVKTKPISARTIPHSSSASVETAEEETNLMQDFNGDVLKSEPEPGNGNGNEQSVVINVYNVVDSHDTNNDKSDTNNGDVNTDNADVRTKVEETSTPEVPNNVYTDSSVSDPSQNNEEIMTKPVQEETPDEIIENGTIADMPRNDICQESANNKNNKKMVALGVNTVDKGDISNKLL